MDLSALNFLVQSISTWTLPQAVAYSAVTYLLISSLGYIAIALVRHNGQHPRRAEHERDRSDTLYTSVNKAFTVWFNHFLMKFCWDNSSVVSFDPADVSLTSTLVAFLLVFLVDDLCYYCWHRALHWMPLYRVCHKHHQ